MISIAPELSPHKIKVSCQNCSLSELCLPRGLSDNEVEELEGFVRASRPMRRGDHLFRAGDRFASLFAVKSGSFKVYTSTEEGDEQVMGFHMPGELLGMDGLDTDIHRCSALALETTSVCELPFPQLQVMCQKSTGLYREMCRFMGREIATEQEMLLLLARKSADARLASFLMSLSQRFKARGFSETEFNLSMSRHDIANYLGLAPETISRLFSRFQEVGVMAVERRLIKILNLVRLKEMVGGCAGVS